MSKLKKAALYFGFTRVEFNIILFLISTFIFGIILTAVKKNSSYTEAQNYNYETRDSLFLSLAGRSSVTDAGNAEEKSLADNTDVRSVEKIILQERSININNADIGLLMKLPGIGEKTAIKILDLRKEKGGFKNIEELKEIKGIGDSKLEKISKYIYIE